MINAAMLTEDAKRLVLVVEEDLRAVLAADAIRDEEWRRHHGALTSGRRTSQDYVSWRDERLTQVAVSWVLTTVFVRFLEDNRLVEPVWFTGTEQRQQQAVEAEAQFFRDHPLDTAREWIMESFDHLGGLPATSQLVDELAPFREIPISGKMAERIIGFWRETDDDGRLVRLFEDSELSTRFLGDLYQDLSQHARETYALLQTPEFVEEFILDRTLEPALAERPLAGFKLIDPTCGSGHFLLGAFDRLVARHRLEDPGASLAEVVERALDSVYGVDINAFAVAIARFRLIIAALTVLGERHLASAPELAVHVVAGDSLLPWGEGGQFTLDGYLQGERIDEFAPSEEDRIQLARILTPGQYDVVVGNPPYITVKDAEMNKLYRLLYSTAIRQYAMTVPFMERFFKLAKPSRGVDPAGWTGQITSNSFMKREFGTKLIEEFLPTKDLRLVVDTSGAYIPGHGTPTVIVVGQNRSPSADTVHAVLGTRGEPGAPRVPAEGLVWQSIVDHVDDDFYENEFITVTRLERTLLHRHPWSLQGGASPDVVTAIDGSTSGRLHEVIDGKIGFASFPGNDSVFFSTRQELNRMVQDAELIRPVIRGDVVRDWTVNEGDWAFVPYDPSLNLIDLNEKAAWFRRQWPLRTSQQNVKGFDGESQGSAGHPWWGWYRWVAARYRLPLSLTFAFVATHNHFVLDRGGKVFNQSAPVIKLPEGATEAEHLNLLGVLNSSVACFWLKQNSHDKGNGGIGGGIADQEWERFFEFTGTTLKDFPLVPADFTELGQRLDALAQDRAAIDVSALASSDQTPNRAMLDAAAKQSTSLRHQAIAVQEELDWFAYGAYGVTDDSLNYAGDVPDVRLGERAFEIALARRVQAGAETTAWFERHRSTPITEIPARWSEDYRSLVQRRLDLIESDRMINLLERPEYKRRWAEDPWDTRVDRALRTWLLDRLEDRAFWFDRQGRPATRSIAQLADLVGRDEELRAVVDLWAGGTDVDLTTALTNLLTTEAVPYLAAWRLKPKAMDKFRAWQHTWELQRKEDAGELDRTTTIPVPPKYTSADFRKGHYMALRGKLDVPKERFIHYPQAGAAGDGTMLLGWAGWNHVEQYLALAMTMDRMVQDGAEDEKLVPLVAGLGESLFWVEQWHDEVDVTYSVNMAEYARTEYDQRRAQIGQSEKDLLDWRPPATTRGRKARR